MGIDELDRTDGSSDACRSRVAYQPNGRSAQASEADARCCRLRWVRVAHGKCVPTGHERCAARENVSRARRYSHRAADCIWIWFEPKDC